MCNFVSLQRKVHEVRLCLAIKASFSALVCTNFASNKIQKRYGNGTTHNEIQGKPTQH